MRQVDDPGADLGHLLLEPAALVGALPVRALEQDVEGGAAPGQALVLIEIRYDRVDHPQGADQGHALGMGNDGRTSLHALQGLVGGDAHDEAVAPGGSGREDVEMPDVEHIEATGYVAGEHQ